MSTETTESHSEYPIPLHDAAQYDASLAEGNQVNTPQTEAEKAVSPSIYDQLGSLDGLQYKGLPTFSLFCHHVIFKTVKAERDNDKKIVKAVVAADPYARQPPIAKLLPEGMVSNFIIDYYRNPALHPGSQDKVHQRVLGETFAKFSRLANQNIETYREIKLVRETYQEVLSEENVVAIAGLEAVYVAYGLTMSSIISTNVAKQRAEIEKHRIRENWKSGIIYPQ
jgi:hypothetical protein